MADRARISLFAVVASGSLLFSGCAYNQQSRFQNSFLPAAPHSESALAEFAAPPAVTPDLYSSEVPNIVRQSVLPAAASRADTQWQDAEQHFQRGKRFYQAQDMEHARAEFNAAIDLMLAASGSFTGDHNSIDKRIDEMVDAIHRYDLSGLGASVTVDDARLEKAPLEDILQMTFPVDPKLKSKVREQVQATVSQLPLSENDTVLGYIHYFSSGRGYKAMVAGLERAGKYKKLISRILDEEGVPQELIHLAQAESGFLPRAMSRKAAGGMWQFVAWRGQQYGLHQTRFADDRFDFEKATRAAAHHLHDLYNEFGDWYLAIAAYNCGPGVVEKAVERTGYADFWELRRRGVLPAETTNYVPIILAMTIMDKNAAEYGLDNITPDPPLEYDTVEITAPTHLALVADLTDVPVSELLTLNPSLLKGIAPEGYALRVPKGTATTLMASLQVIPPDRRASWRMHKVESGETLAAIGRRFGASANSIAAANHLAGGAAVAGQRLVIPAVYKESSAAVKRVSARRAPAHRAVARRRAGGTHGARAAAPRAHRGPAVLARTASNARRRAAAQN